LEKCRFPQRISHKEIMTEEDIRSLFSENLKRLRGRLGLSQFALADKADLTHNFVNDIENGKKWVSPKTLAKLADALRIAPHELLLPERKLSKEDSQNLEHYIDDFSFSLLRSVQDLKAKYLPPEEEKE
jgi:transcriptional regulator with XRE-family HTH domain